MKSVYVLSEVHMGYEEIMGTAFDHEIIQAMIDKRKSEVPFPDGLEFDVQSTLIYETPDEVTKVLDT